MIQDSVLKIVEQSREKLMLVDAANNVTGSIDKIAAHQGVGKLHRAFTIFLQNEKGEWLITQRSQQKPLWPLWWDAACSSHPWFPNETIEQAALRRLPFELGLAIEDVSQLKEAYTYEYHAIYSSAWSENEINHIIVAKYDGSLVVNPNEVAKYLWLPKQQIGALIGKCEFFAPWFKQAWDSLI